MRRPVSTAITLLLLGIAISPAAWAERESTCITCHAEEDDAALSDPVEEWRKSIHAEVEVSCDGCHGGDPRKSDADASMSEEAGFLEAPAWKDVVAQCGVCHEELADSYLDGSLGRAMGAGERPPTCVDCHMAEGHRIREAGPRALEYAEGCPHCLPLPDGAGAEQGLRANRAAVREVFLQLERVEQKGMEAGDLTAELAALYRAHGEAIHHFEVGGIEYAGEALRPNLSALAVRAAELEAEAEERRRYGIFVLLPVGMLALGLFFLPRSPGNEEK